MPKETIYADVANATVSVPGGLGVLVNDWLIVTAAHCVTWSLEGDMVIGRPSFEPIAAHGRETMFAALTLAVEPVKDIAVLGSPVHDEFEEERIDFEEFCRNTKPVPVYQSDLESEDTFPVHIYTHKETWVTGIATGFGGAAFSVVADEQIEGGTSGGPIINDSGELVGIVSNFTETAEGLPKSQGSVPYPALALPVWVCRRIFG